MASTSNGTRWVCLIALLASVVLVPGCGDARGARAPAALAPVTSVESWVERTSRSGFTLLDSAELDDYFIAVYRTERGEIAFCCHWRGDTTIPDNSIAVLHEAGRPVNARSDENTTTLNPTGPLPAGGFIHGAVMPIDPTHAGPVRVVFKDDHRNTKDVPSREVYAKTLPWGS